VHWRTSGVKPDGVGMQKPSVVTLKFSGSRKQKQRVTPQRERRLPVNHVDCNRRLAFMSCLVHALLSSATY